MSFMFSPWDHLSKFYNPAIEAVEKLNFYDPDLVKDSFFISNNPSSKKFSMDKDTTIITSLSILLNKLLI